MQIKSITVAELLRLPIMEKCKLVAGTSGAERREVRRINIIDTPDIAHWMLGEEFLMTTAYVMRENPLEIKDLIIELNNKNVSALGIKLGRFINTLPDEVLKIADELEFPLFSLPMDCSFSQVMIEVMDILSRNGPDVEDRPQSEFNYQDYVAGSFLEMMVLGKGINEILRHLKTLINAEIVYLDSRKQAFFVTDENSSFYESVISRSLEDIQEMFHVFSLDMAGENFGILAINSPRQTPIPLSWHSSINFAKTAIVLYLQREIAVKQAELKHKSSFLKDLIFHHIHPDDDMIDEKVAAFFGASFLAPFIVMVLDRDNITSYEEKGRANNPDPQKSLSLVREELYSRIYHFLKMHYGRIHYTNIGGKMVALVSTHPDSKEGLLKLEKLLSQLKSDYMKDSNCTISIAISGVVPEILKVGYGYKQAKTCIDFVRSTGMQDAFFIWSKLGIIRLLIAASNNKANQEEIRDFVDQYLGGFKHLPSAEAQRLLDTLGILSGNGWNLKLAAKDMHVHYNTVRYRMKTIAGLIPFDLENPETRVEIHLALKLYHLNKDLRLF